ncbi:glutathione S-transferase family protein [Xinfangfangia sp. CPCC 101601]|uniref:Glutathione S-transferase family protein n=1 Tax=Pseudogemmobacter lacusdianii TaxID=3069608 RepID=A0ABU0VVK1_9RHOB|nr:glutathione S-transferase family protein [Xinfangfangia sp. CPCC 101601]MDQ2065776.1 glutathione S-transferase family protein [Xinfangfangia sp. CPCC 101601]
MLTLHYTPDTAALPVHIMLEALGLAYKLRLIDREGGELASPSYRALHPLGKVPLLETPDGPLFETAAILLWLADRHAPGTYAPAPDDIGRGDFLKWLFFTSSNLHPAVMELFYPERIAGAAAVDALLPLASARAKAALKALEQAARAEPALFPQDRLALLPLYAGTLMRWLGQLPPDHPARLQIQDYPALRASLAASESSAAALTVAKEQDLGATLFTHPDC